MAEQKLDQYFYPDYLKMDFKTLVEKFRTVLSQTDTFRDVNYEGSNISVLLELMAYIGDLNTYYLNKIAKNVYLDTVDIYENAHRLCELTGYTPKGYISSAGTATITVDNTLAPVVNGVQNYYFGSGDTFYIPLWHKLFTQNGIPFVVSEPVTFTVPSSAGNSVSFEVPVKQAEPTEKFEVYYQDIIDYKIYLPNLTFDHDNNYFDDWPTLFLWVNDELWTPVQTFFDPLAILGKTRNLYRLIFDKYKRYAIEFSPFYNMPKELDKIQLQLLVTRGKEGNVGAKRIEYFDEGLLTNVSRTDFVDYTKPLVIPSSMIKVANQTATGGGQDPEDIVEMKKTAKGYLYSQSRTVTSDDYAAFLKERSDVDAAFSWGERDLDIKGNINLYNKIFFTVIPDLWGTNTLELSGYNAAELFKKYYDPKDTTPKNIYAVKSVNLDYVDSLIEYLRPRKMICSIEQFEIPELVYFRFDFGIRVKRTYNFLDAVDVVKRKLKYFFKTQNRYFGEQLSFMDLHNFILDPTVVSTEDKFTEVKGIDNLIFRDIDVIYCQNDNDAVDPNGNYLYTMKTEIHAPNTVDLYPRYSKDMLDLYPKLDPNDLINLENKLKIIQLGPRQFPMLALKLSTFVNEGY